MSSELQNTRILAVDTAPAMLEVLKNFASKNGYDCEGFSDPANAEALITELVSQNTCNFRCLLLGWPQGDATMINSLIETMTSPAYGKLPIVIVCQESDEAAFALARQRQHTTAIVWKEYQRAADIIDRLPVVRLEAPVLPEKSNEADARHVQSDPKSVVLMPEPVELSTPAQLSGADHTLRALLVDNAPSVVEALHKKMTVSGYEVTTAQTVTDAVALIKTMSFDVIVTDYKLHQVKGKNQLQTFYQSMSAQGEPAMLVVLTARYSDQVINAALDAGAVSCLFKNESTDLIFARVHALTRSLTGRVLPSQHERSEQCQSSTEPAAVADQLPSAAAIEPVGIGAQFKRRLAQTLQRVANKQHEGVRYSVLLLDVQIEAATGDRMSLGDSEPMCRIVEDALSRLYKRPESLAYLGNGQFALLFASGRLQDTLMLTRQVLQVVPRMVRYLNDMALISHSALVRIDGSTTQPDDFLTQCRTAVARTRKDRRDNCALVMPMKKYLNAVEERESALADPAN